jgi:DNA-binding PadR family transcriptional regulator
MTFGHIFSDMNVTSKEELIPMTPQMTQVLTALAFRPMYVYGLIGQCDHDSRGTVKPSYGSVYRMMAKLESQGLVIAIGQRYGIASPHMTTFYELTKIGYEVLGWEAERIARVYDLIIQRRTLNNNGNRTKFSPAGI